MNLDYYFRNCNNIEYFYNMLFCSSKLEVICSFLQEESEAHIFFSREVIRDYLVYIIMILINFRNN